MRRVNCVLPKLEADKLHLPLPEVNLTEFLHSRARCRHVSKTGDRAAAGTCPASRSRVENFFFSHVCHRRQP